MFNMKYLETNLSPYKRRLEEIKVLLAIEDSGTNPAIQFSTLRSRRLAGESATNLLPETYALVFRAVESTLGLTPHDVQLLGAIALAEGRVIELATGEGKTLVAVFAACLGALDGAGVHVLTANDYLAERDATWMGPVYRELDITADSIVETSPLAHRKAAYGGDVTYLTAKEAGFDYLRDFLAYAPGDLVQRPFHLAVIDEVDSILIDDARIPLVVGDNTSAQSSAEGRVINLMKELELGRHVNLDDHGSVIYLEDEGIAYLERALGLDNLYDSANLALLEKIDAAVKAVFQLRRDIDYIVRDRQVLIVDPVTGRVAQKRQWTDGVHAAVEEKEGLGQTLEGRVMGRITFRDLLELYPAFCGMTGTARSSASEFYRFYSIGVTVIPPNAPCIRMDIPDVVFSKKTAKYKAAVVEICQTHETGQPVLVATGSVAESELLADMLRHKISAFNILNAKNDAEEARIIAEAGRLNAVTISTNMAGRGVDIPLGGTGGEETRAVRELGGLYVIGLNRHESVRIDNQLRGRAGRQGDPGRSRFFASLEDDLYMKYGLEDIIPEKYRDMDSDKPLENRIVKKVVARMQGIVEVQIADAKATLFKYGQLLEDQRAIIHSKRRDVLLGQDHLDILKQLQPEQYDAFLEKVSQKELARAERQITLYAFNKCWSDYLLFVDSALSEVRIISSIKEDPLTYYNRKLHEGFIYMEESVRQTVLDCFSLAEVQDGRINLEAMAVFGPTNINTYMIHDGTEGQDLIDGIGTIGAAAFGAPLFFLYLLAGWTMRKKH